MTDDVRQRFARVLAAIEGDLARPAAAAELAERAGYSTWHFQRLFAALVGEPVASYQRRRRLTAAAQLMREQPRLRLIDIAMAFGFESHEAFTRAFRATAGMAPSSFRQTVRDRERWMRSPQRADLLNFIPPVMNLEPTLIDLPALRLVGVSAPFIAAMSPDATNMKVIPPLWDELLSRRFELAIEPDAIAFGACRCLSPERRTRDDEMEYLAGFEVAPEELMPIGMVRWDIPAHRYACFVHRGPVAKFAETVNYVFASWFPRSEYEYFGTELERYGPKFHPMREDSEVEFLVPIRRRSAGF